MMQHDPVIWAIPLFLVLIAVELYLNWRHKYGWYEWKDTAASLAMGAGSVVIGAGVKLLAFLYFTWLHQFALFPEIGWQWWAWILCFFADDLTFYIHHRASHEVRILWAAHVNHHSSQKINFGTALRQSWTEILYKYFWWTWLPLLGFEPLMVMIMMSISLIFQFFQHTEAVRKFPKIIEFFFNTPSHHRVHHASNIRYLDQNHAGVLIIWDRIFGTFAEEEDQEKPVYGITKNINSYNPLFIASHGFAELWEDVKRAPDWRTKMKYVFYPPGWSHDGPDLRARILRKQALHGKN
jgi:sterol desaturase/sphingolipid hydroxylase (fatty acid hydroxylase superfamily)